MDSYYVKTDEIKTLDELKEDVANGNLDPYTRNRIVTATAAVTTSYLSPQQKQQTHPVKQPTSAKNPVAGNPFDCIAQTLTIHNTTIKYSFHQP